MALRAASLACFMRAFSSVCTRTAAAKSADATKAIAACRLTSAGRVARRGRQVRIRAVRRPDITTGHDGRRRTAVCACTSESLAPDDFRSSSRFPPCVCAHRQPAKLARPGWPGARERRTREYYRRAGGRRGKGMGREGWCRTSRRSRSSFSCRSIALEAQPLGTRVFARMHAWACVSASNAAARASPDTALACAGAIASAERAGGCAQCTESSARARTGHAQALHAGNAARAVQPSQC